jgi:tripartite-type tricarboxylate transporter receptor subunit TctC
MIHRLLPCVLACAAVHGIAADNYPSRPVRVIAAQSAGSSLDTLARIVMPKVGDALNQQFVIDNRGGAGGTIGVELAARAAPDGYTLLLGASSSMIISKYTYKNLPFDAEKDFDAVSNLVIADAVMVTHPSVPAKTVKELIALAKAQPGKLSFASPGIGTPPHLIGELFKLRTGTDLVHVPYKGGGQSLGDVAGGQVQMVFENPSITLPLARAGKVRALASTGETRNPASPELPTMIESGLANFVTLSFTGLVAPAGTPSAIIDKLNAAANESLNAPDMRALLARLAVEPRPGTPLDFASLVGEETVKWRAVINAAHIRID